MKTVHVPIYGQRVCGHNVDSYSCLGNETSCYREERNGVRLVANIESGPCEVCNKVNIEDIKRWIDEYAEGKES